MGRVLSLWRRNGRRGLGYLGIVAGALHAYVRVVGVLAILSDMEITISLSDQIARRAEEQAANRGITLVRLVEEFLTELADRTDRERLADEFVSLSALANGNSGTWKFNRDELHERSSG